LSLIQGRQESSAENSAGTAQAVRFGSCADFKERGIYAASGIKHFKARCGLKPALHGKS
jgi:hypothetical protein